jgi:hypothetical protein
MAYVNEWPARIMSYRGYAPPFILQNQLVIGAKIRPASRTGLAALFRVDQAQQVSAKFANRKDVLGQCEGFNGCGR